MCGWCLELYRSLNTLYFVYILLNRRIFYMCRHIFSIFIICVLGIYLNLNGFKEKRLQNRPIVGLYLEVEMSLQEFFPL